MTPTPDEPSLRDRIHTYRDTQTRDALGIAGEAAATAAGGAAGYGLASTIAGWFGANVTTYAVPAAAKALSWLPAGLLKWAGITATATVTTPTLWVVGSAVACAGLAFVIARWVRGGGIQDERRKQLGRDILNKIEQWYRQRQRDTTDDAPARIETIAATFVELGQQGVLPPDRVDVYVERLRDGRLKPEVALAILRELGQELVHPTIDPSRGDADGQIRKAAASRAFTALHKGVASDAEEPGEAYLDAMQRRFAIPRERALALYRAAPLDPNPRETAGQLADIFQAEVIDDACQALQEAAQSLARGQAAFVRFLEVQQVLEQRLGRQLSALDQAGQDARNAIGRL